MAKASKAASKKAATKKVAPKNGKKNRGAYLSEEKLLASGLTPAQVKKVMETANAPRRYKYFIFLTDDEAKKVRASGMELSRASKPHSEKKGGTDDANVPAGTDHAANAGAGQDALFVAADQS